MGLLTVVACCRLAPYVQRSMKTPGFTRRWASKDATRATKQAVRPEGKPAIRSKVSELRKLFGLAKPEKWRLSGAVGLLLVSSSVTMSVPFCMGKVIDILYSSEGGDTMVRLNYICSVLVGVFLVGAVANFGRVYIMQSSGQRIIKALRERVFSSILSQEVGFFDRTKTGELINRLSADTSLVGQSLTMNISDGLRSSVQAVACVGMMLYVSPKLSVMALGIVPALAGLTVVYGRYLKGIARDVQDSLAKSTEVAEERISNIRTVRAFAQEGRELEKYSDRVDHVLGLSYKESLARAVFFSLTGLSGNVMVLSVFYYGGVLMQDSLITVGELSSFLLYAAFTGVSIGGLSSFFTELMKAVGASTRLWELAEKQPDIPLTDGLIPSQPIAGRIEFRGVQFSYPSRPDTAVFSDLDLTVLAGTVLAVVGPSGSGKSTLAALLLRFYDPEKGVVELDGADIKTLNPSWLRHHVGTVSQEPVLFSCSIRENIAYGAIDPATVTDEQVLDAAKKSNAHVFVESFPEKYDTVVGERGVMLSGGQRQRIAIARAILKDPKILILDEATSALDSESEYLVQEALERVMTDRTVIIIAHRLSTIKNADRIVVMDEGAIVEAGSYTELMSTEDGLFRKLVDRQTIES